MARKNDKNEQKLNYSAEVKTLKAKGPQRLYLLWGPEDYLRELYAGELKKICLPDGDDDFSYKRMNGPELDYTELRIAIDAMPFLTERTYIELRGVDINKLKEPEKLLEILKDIPDYCTVAFIQSAEYEFDGRIKLVKGLREIATELKFTEQSQDSLVGWIKRRFEASGKGVELEAAQQLIFISGDTMNRLIPEIEKVAAYAKGDRVTVQDVMAVANHIPEADVFAMTEFIAKKEYDKAMNLLSELLSDKNNEPIMLLAIIGMQMRRLYIARIAVDMKLGTKYFSDLTKIRHDFVANKTMAAARGFTPRQIMRAVEICAETDFKMKSSGADDVELLREAVLRIAAGESYA